MPRLVQHYLTGEWICVAKERAHRPNQYRTEKDEKKDARVGCPFCPENRLMTPTEILASNDGLVRIVPNKYPAVSPTSAEGYGIHDVVIDTPLHDEKLPFFSMDHIVSLLQTIQTRMAQIHTLEEIKYIQVFKNDGRGAGASIFHSHFQIIALPIVPQKQFHMSHNFHAYYHAHGSCFLCDELKKQSPYILLEDSFFVSRMPEISPYPYGVEIIPKRHFSDYLDCTAQEIEHLARILKKTLLALYRFFDPFSYNICFQNCVYDGIQYHSHFFIQILPRVGHMAGFEFSTGSFINGVDTQQTIEKLKELLYEN